MEYLKLAGFFMVITPGYYLTEVILLRIMSTRKFAAASRAHPPPGIMMTVLEPAYSEGGLVTMNLEAAGADVDDFVQRCVIGQQETAVG